MARDNDDPNLSTKYACQVGLAVSWIVSIVVIVLGAKLNSYNHQRGIMTNNSPSAESVRHEITLKLSSNLKELFPLFVNLGVTALNESMGYIHTCSLRWSLQNEGRLKYSSNLRLFKTAHKHWANSWPANALFGLGILMVYASTSMVFLTINGSLYTTLYRNRPNAAFGVDDARLYINPAAVIAFGTGLGLQAIIATWALFTTKIPTWSSHPLKIAHKCMDPDENKIPVEYRPGRCMISVHMRDIQASPQKPRPRQKHMFAANRNVRLVFFLELFLLVCALAWGAIVYIMVQNGHAASVLGDSWAFLPNANGTIYGPGAAASNDTSASASAQHRVCRANSCTTGTSIFNIRWSAMYYEYYIEIATIACVALFQLLLTLSLHCAELLVNQSRDETAMRKLIHGGTICNASAILAAISSKTTMTLFFFKAAMHWMFGMAINVSYRIGICIYLAFRRHRGYLPSTFGHIQTIVDIVDEWNHTGSLLWGHKYDGNGTKDAPHFAGTSCKQKLGEIQEGKVYGGAPPVNEHGRPNNQSDGSFVPMVNMNTAV